MMTQEEFESKYHYKIVRQIGHVYQDIPEKEYIVTSALIGEEESIFAIKAVDYNTENKHWFTFHLSKADFDAVLADFEIIGDGYEKYVKPVILEEILYKCIGEYDQNWIFEFYSYTRKIKNIVNIRKADLPQDPSIGQMEYSFIYKSIFDIDAPQVYKFPIPPNINIEDAEKYISPLRDDVLNNKVAFGINQRLLNQK